MLCKYPDKFGSMRKLVTIYSKALCVWNTYGSTACICKTQGLCLFPPFLSFPPLFPFSVYTPCISSLKSLRFIVCSLLRRQEVRLLACVCVCVSERERLWGLQGGNGLATCRDLWRVYAWLREIREWHGLIWVRADQVFVLLLSLPPSLSLFLCVCVFLCWHTYNLWEMECPPALVLYSKCMCACASMWLCVCVCVCSARGQWRLSSCSL